MPASSQKAPNIRHLRLSPDQLKAAKKFASDIGIGRNDDLYYYALLWYKENVRADGDFLSPSKRKRYDKELEKKKNNKTYKGAIGREIIGQIVILSTQKIEDKDLLKDTDTNTTPTIKAATVRVRKKTTQVAPPKPKVTISLDKEEVEKGESYTVSWKSENANYVSRSRGFTPQLKDVDLSGSQTLKAERLGSKTFYITVRNHKGSIAIASATIIIVQEKTIDSPGIGPRQQPPSGTTTPQKPRATTTRVSRQSTVLNDIQIFKKIHNSLSNILELLEKQSGIIKAVEKTRKKDAENERRSKRESILETAKGAGGLLVEKALTPIKSIFEKIWRFILFTLLGRAFTEFLNWFNDPKNADKVKTLSRFLKDNFWLLIGGAALYFLTPFGGFINKLIGKLAWFSTKLVLSKAAQLMLKNPLLTIAAVSAFARQATYENLKPELDKMQEQVQKDMQNESLPWYKRLGSFFANQELEGLKRKGYTEAIPAPGSMYATGGFITTNTGDKIRGAGSDTQLTALTPGEIVMNRPTVQAVGADNLLALNKMYGGANANKPKKLNNIIGMSGGGMVGEQSVKIIQGAKRIIGMGAGTSNQCANTTRAALKFAGNPFANKLTNIGDLDTPKGKTQFTQNPAMAASLAGSDLGQVIRSKSSIKAGDLIFWKADINKGGSINKGAITHVGISADDGLKHQYDHNKEKGWHYRPHWHSSDNTSWFAGIRLKGKSADTSKPKPKSRGFGNMFGTLLRPAGGERTNNNLNSFLNPTGGERTNNNLNSFLRPAGVEWGGDARSKPFSGRVTSKMPTVKGDPVDRHFAALAQNEYVVPSFAVQRYGAPVFDKIVQSAAKTSNVRKINAIKENINFNLDAPTPANNFQTIKMPPIIKNNTASLSSSSGGTSQIPTFPTVSPQASETRSFLAEIYKIA